MAYTIMYYENPESISDVVRMKMLDAVRDVYDDETAQEFAMELDQEFPYGYVVISDDATGLVIALGALMKSGLDFDIWEFAWGLVRADYRGHGLGKCLNDERIKVVRQNGGKKILCVTKKLWHLERSGFRSMCVFADGDNLMAREL